MGRRVASCSDISYLYITRRKKISEIENDSLLIKADYIHGVRHTVVTTRPGPGLAYRNCKTVVGSKFVERGFKSTECVPISGHQHQNSEFSTQCGHAAFFDISATRENHFRNVLNDARSVCANC